MNQLSNSEAICLKISNEKVSAKTYDTDLPVLFYIRLQPEQIMFHSKGIKNWVRILFHSQKLEL